jgi:hypothetical protein
MAIAELKALEKLKYLTGNQTRDLPTCSKLPTNDRRLPQIRHITISFFIFSNSLTILPLSANLNY